jgi:hypothetical protein
MKKIILLIIMCIMFSSIGLASNGQMFGEVDEYGRKKGIHIETGKYGYTSLTFYDNDRNLGQLDYDTYGSIRLQAVGASQIRLCGKTEYLDSSSNEEIATKGWIQDEYINFKGKITNGGINIYDIDGKFIGFIKFD